MQLCAFGGMHRKRIWTGIYIVSSRCGPETSVCTKNGCLSDLAGANKVIVDVCLPGHDD